MVFRMVYHGGRGVLPRPCAVSAGHHVVDEGPDVGDTEPASWANDGNVQGRIGNGRENGD